MKYTQSINQQPIKLPINFQTQSQILLILNKDNTIKVLEKIGQKIILGSYDIENSQKNHTVTVILTAQQMNIPSRIKQFYFDGMNCFLVLSNPVGLYFISQYSQQLIQIMLQQPIQLQQCQFYFNFPYLYIYGHQCEQFQNKLQSINLTTFEIKIICSGKKYSPGSRTNFIAQFNDQRLYLFGGFDKKKDKCQNLLWTFDFQKGFWFALQINFPQDIITQKLYKCQYKKGKTIFYDGKSKCFIAEFYQSKILEIENHKIQDIVEEDKEKIKEQIKGLPQNIIGIYYFQNQLIYYNSSNPYLKFSKIVTSK